MSRLPAFTSLQSKAVFLHLSGPSTKCFHHRTPNRVDEQVHSTLRLDLKCAQFLKG